MAKKGEIRVGIVGFGFMGRMHYGNWKKMKGAGGCAVRQIWLNSLRLPPAATSPVRIRRPITVMR